MSVMPQVSLRAGLPLDWKRLWLGRRTYWACQFGGWVGNVAYGLGVMSIMGESDLLRRVSPWALTCFLGLLVSHLLRATVLCLRARTAGWRLVGGVLVSMLLAAVVGTVLFRSAYTPLFETLYTGARIRPLGPFLGSLNEFVFVLTGWTASYFAITNYREFRAGLEERLRLETALKEAELRALRTQINPHFLFNSLNLLRALIPKELRQPREAVTLLADVLRASLSVGEQETIPLERELATVDSYLTIEQLRYGSRLRISRSIAPATANRPIPPFLVQGLVENAIKFGITPREEGGEISLTTEIRGDSLLITITNPGRIFGATDSTGLGLRNARLRLDHLFGPAAHLSLIQREGELVAAEVLIPAQPKPAAP